MTLAKVALDDDLFIEYFRFMNGKSQNHQLINKLFSHLKMPFVVDSSQATRCNPDLSPEIKTQFLAGGQPPKTIKELAEQSLYKIALTSDDAKLTYPFVNVNSPKVELNYSITCQPNESRAQLIQHLTELCCDATKVVICDNYFFSDWSDTALGTTGALFNTILSKKNINVEFPHFGPGKRRKALLIKAIEDKWNVVAHADEVYSEQKLHDRYLLIETAQSKIEVILSSGFSALWNNAKEITCVFREIT